MKLPNISKLRISNKVLIILAVIVVFLGAGEYIYYGRNTSNVYNAGGYGTNNPQNPISTTNSNASSAGTITVPCKCQLKNLGSQPGQNATSGSTLQGGSTSSTPIQTCNPCPENGAETATTTLCPEYMCKAPTPNPAPSPTPAPMPSPSPGCGTCGGGYRKTGTTSSMYVCPMYCVE